MTIAPFVRPRTRLPVDHHLARVLELASPQPAVLVDLRSARGRVLAADVHAPADLPAFDNAAMDGYAFCRADLPNGHGALPVSADIPAGRPLGHALAPGTAARIMTGAPLPDGADSVVQVEWTEAGTDVVHVRRVPPAGGNVRRRAQELPGGALLLSAGTELTPVRLGLLAAVGVARVTVQRRTRVAVLTAGNELVAPGALRGAGRVFDADATLLTALLDADGAATTVLPAHPDDPDLVLAMLSTAAVDHDLILTAGGISAGAYEVVKQALGPLGSVQFGNIAMTPGSPQGHGRIATTPVLALPGNPTAALVSYLAFVRPFLQRCQGAPAAPAPHLVVTAHAMNTRRDATTFVPAAIEHGGVSPLARALGSAHHLTSFAGADVVLRLDPRDGPLAAGALVPVLCV